MVARITSICVGISLILLTVGTTVSVASYCGPDPGCPPVKVQVRGPGMPCGVPAMAGPRPMPGMASCPPPCPPQQMCPPPCPPPSCAPPPCPPPMCEQRGCFNPLSCVFDLLALPFRIFGWGSGGCEQQACAPPCMPMPSCAPPCPPVAKVKPPKGGFRPMMPY